MRNDLTLAFIGIMLACIYVLMSPDDSVQRATIIVGSDVQTEVECQFEKPLKHVTLIMHWYDDYTELNFDYQTLVQPEDPDSEVWGWSNCAWQPDDDWAACDVYAVVPDYVHADMGMDTLGHEVLHGACGAFHD